MFKGLAPWLERVPGRLLHTNIIGCTIFAAVSGSSAATCATIGKMTLPELKSRGYPDDITIGTLAGAGKLGLLIPPSIDAAAAGVPPVPLRAPRGLWGGLRVPAPALAAASATSLLDPGSSSPCSRPPHRSSPGSSPSPTRSSHRPPPP